MDDIFVKDKDILKKVEVNDICFFTRRNSKVFLIMEGLSIEVDTTLYYLNELLGKNFIRSHKSFIININKIDKILKYNEKTYNITFKGIKEEAFITKRNLKLLTQKISIV